MSNVSLIKDNILRTILGKQIRSGQVWFTLRERIVSNSRRKSFRRHSESKDEKPQTVPIEDKNDLIDWSEEAESQDCRTQIPLNFKLSANRKKKERKLCIVHKMNEQYTEDRFTDYNPHNKGYNLKFSLPDDVWAIADVFIYYSDYFISIPPRYWLDKSHYHGVRALGVIRSEHQGAVDEHSGRAINTNIEYLLEQPIEACQHIEAVSRFFGIDGWLVHIENDIIGGPDRIVRFIKWLKKTQGNDSIILVSDTINKHGRNIPQNELNKHNSKLFKCADGILINFGWSDNPDVTLEVTRKEAEKVHRNKDVYVNVDVSAQQSGGYYTAGPGVVTALNAVKNHNLSVALHNPGWTWVDFKSGRRRSSKLEYFRIAKKFWADVMPFLK